MAERIKLDPDDATPASVYAQIANQNATMYPKGDCMPCGATIRMGFFFDAFGRHRDIDDKSSSQYSNIARLWDAHRDTEDPKCPANQFWFRFYYSGLGTPVNESAKANEWINASVAAAKMAGKKALSGAESTAKSFMRVNTAIKQASVKKRVDDVKKQLLDGFLEGDFSLRPIDKAFQDLRKDIEHIPAQARRVMNVLNASPERYWERTKATGTLLWRNAKNDFKNNVKGAPMKAGWAVARSLFVGIAMENVPIVRDNSVMAKAFGTGVDTRLIAAKDQFKAAYDAVKTHRQKIRTIEVSVFGADRGCVLARAFINDLAEKYKRRDDTDLAIDGVSIQIKFVGLLDAVSSVMSEEAGELIGMVPYLGMLKTSFKDRPLAIPASVQRCVHFAAAHEMRFYQRLDSLEKTRGEQFLYPGTSCDVVGGAPNGSFGFNAELMRIPLRDMLLEALKAGSVMDTMEDLRDKKPDTFKKFTIAQPINSGGKQYRIKQLVDAYRALVPRKPGVDFMEHSKVFMRWIAARYLDPEFRRTMSDPVADWKRNMADADLQRKTAKSQLDWELQRQGINMSMLASRSPADQSTLRGMKAASDAAQKRYEKLIAEAPKDYTTVWERLEKESAKKLRQATYQDGLRQSAERIRNTPDSWDSNNKASADAVEAAMLPEAQMELVSAWKEGIEGKHPLPPDVMALFDMLVHDTLLTSWQDHVLAPSLYFRTRDKDEFGSSNFDKEAKQRKKDDLAAARIDQAAKQSQEWAKGYKGGATPPIH
ncbi:hypothetical protein BBJ41_12180 [Burkholderia stabilis]|uniref:DUF2235 domain-containing protein n=1 Tax=Burkholderia stabilis TaxID=95485 RepID=UPI000851D000|nr:DUF2235 domain-containing protein [Burkholderia stabilis]AOR68230.1 hypothetical protein BBJ41_12180 [Burkholderia stabilis]HDR9493171.1 DUF2235 domain-containing protein [Burkholderia stabilis]HDR9525244.1 DUF2235 domain-containing protein [Burkholderia stabilis]HDR9532559.1 DUF2235 domain-containing protein [Burkholderia stabilis]HDR9540401.1 DUF2235 domain-containing protein [Burkholderia stabilis]